MFYENSWIYFILDWCGNADSVMFTNEYMDGLGSRIVVVDWVQFILWMLKCSDCDESGHFFYITGTFSFLLYENPPGEKTSLSERCVGQRILFFPTKTCKKS